MEQAVKELVKVQALKHTKTQEQQKYNIIIYIILFILYSSCDDLINTEFPDQLHWI